MAVHLFLPVVLPVFLFGLWAVANSYADFSELNEDPPGLWEDVPEEEEKPGREDENGPEEKKETVSEGVTVDWGVIDYTPYREKLEKQKALIKN